MNNIKLYNVIIPVIRRRFYMWLEIIYYYYIIIIIIKWHWYSQGNILAHTGGAGLLFQVHFQFITATTRHKLPSTMLLYEQQVIWKKHQSYTSYLHHTKWVTCMFSCKMSFCKQLFMCNKHPEQHWDFKSLHYSV